MARPKGSKNVIREKIDELEGLLDSPEQKEEIEKIYDEIAKEMDEKRILLGYHPITGAEVWLE